jgi:16S rRNA (cytosine967-C5)-methyltransferase
VRGPTSFGAPSPSAAPTAPSRPEPRTARQLAWRCLVDAAADPTEPFTSDLLDERRTALADPRERGLATELTLGVIRRQRSLELLIRPLLNRPWEDLEPDLRRLLSLGAYQLVCCDGIPAHAAVHETVALAEWSGVGRWTGFANGVLRGLARSLTDEFAEGPGRNQVPVGPGRYRVLSTAPFVDPTLDFARHAAQAWSFPDWLVQRWYARLGRERLIARLEWFNRPAPPCLRINPARGDRANVLTQLATAGIEATAGEWPESVRLADTVSAERLPGLDTGEYSIQDEAAMSAARLLEPQAGERLLDLCAAPGGKATHLAELTGDGARIVACDVDSERLEMVHRNVRRLGLKGIETRLLARTSALPLQGEDWPAESFDGVLLDVPCSNTGVMGKRPEARWRLRVTEFAELAELQGGLLDRAARLTRPGGRIVYSTCSIEPEENEVVVAAFLARAAGWRLVREVAWLPGEPTDGAYQARLERVS